MGLCINRGNQTHVLLDQKCGIKAGGYGFNLRLSDVQWRSRWLRSGFYRGLRWPWFDVRRADDIFFTITISVLCALNHQVSSLWFKWNWAASREERSRRSTMKLKALKSEISAAAWTQHKCGLSHPLSLWKVAVMMVFGTRSTQNDNMEMLKKSKKKDTGSHFGTRSCHVGLNQMGKYVWQRDANKRTALNSRYLRRATIRAK